MLGISERYSYIRKQFSLSKLNSYFSSVPALLSNAANLWASVDPKSRLPFAREITHTSHTPVTTEDFIIWKKTIAFLCGCAHHFKTHTQRPLLSHSTKFPPSNLLCVTVLQLGETDTPQQLSFLRLSSHTLSKEC